MNVTYDWSLRPLQVQTWNNDEAQAILDQARDAVAKIGQKPVHAGIAVSREA